MRKSYKWKDHALDNIRRISEMTLHSNLGLHCDPDEYLNMLDDYTKLLFDMNKVPDHFIDDLEKLDNRWTLFKHLLIEYCKKLSLEMKQINENPIEEEE